METTVKHQCPGALLPEGIPPKASESFQWKGRQTKASLFSSLWKRLLSQKDVIRGKLLKPVLAAVPEVQMLLLTQKGAVAVGAKTLFFTGRTKGHFLTTKGWSSLSHHQIDDWNSPEHAMMVWVSTSTYFILQQVLVEKPVSTIPKRLEDESTLQEGLMAMHGHSLPRCLEPGGRSSLISWIWCRPACLE